MKILSCVKKITPETRKNNLCGEASNKSILIPKDIIKRHIFRQGCISKPIVKFQVNIV